MAIITTTHLNFRGEALAALEFYQSVFGGDLTATRYADVGMPADAPAAQNIVFGQVASPNGFRIMAYDIPGPDAEASTPVPTVRENGVTMTDQTFFVSIATEDFAEAERYANALSVAGAIVEPLAASAWSRGFGMLTDRFGVTWIIGVASA